MRKYVSRAKTDAERHPVRFESETIFFPRTTA